jgi:hypothetical protein
MVKRRPLTAGIKKADPKKEKAFVYGKNAAPSASPKEPKAAIAAKPEAPVAAPEPVQETPAAATVTEKAAPRNQGRSPLTTRIRTDLFEALKRASLERQLAKQDPHTVQDILEEALEPWLKNHGY